MLVLVTYDVSLVQPRRAPGGCAVSPRPARIIGQRVQFSVFEIEVDPAQWTTLKARLEGLIDPSAGQPALLLSRRQLAAARRACRHQAGHRSRRPLIVEDAEFPVRREPQAWGRTSGRFALSSAV